MTRALSTRSSKKRTAKASQESIPDEYKETSPTLLSQSSIQIKSKSKSKGAAASKENVLPRGTSRSIKLSQNSDEINVLPLRKSVRHMNASSNHHHESKQYSIERKVLNDKTNYSTSDKINETSCNVQRTHQDNGNTCNFLNNISKPDLLYPMKNKIPNISYDCSNTTRIPVYKKIECPQALCLSPKLSVKTEAVYEFEIDENEEPKQTRKRKKRVYSKKPKIGPKALTINNIKYSSCESLVSLPEWPVARKKVATSNVQVKTCFSTTDINDTQSTSCSVKSFMSQPSTRVRYRNENQRPTNLSILHETQSEQLPSPCHSINTIELLNKSVIDTQESLHSLVSTASNRLDPSSVHNVYPSPKHKLFQNDLATNSTVDLQHSTYPSEVNDTLPRHSTSGPVNVSIKSQDFLSSTPCKRVSLVVCNNSVFDDSYDCPQGLRPSTGFIKNSSKISISKDSCFGFDEPEELEEPLVSPIKKGYDNNYKTKKTTYIRPQHHENEPLEKPSINEVIQMLKATVPKTAKEPGEGDCDSPNHSPPSSPSSNKDIQVNFRKPPRRSYERQRRVRYVEESEEESEPDIAQEQLQEQDTNLEKNPKEVKKCYKRGNSSKSVKSKKGAKGKQKSAKEEEEMERIAALMNAQFHKIEKTDLVVE